MDAKQGRVRGCEPGQTEGDKERECVCVCVLVGKKGIIISPLIIWFESLKEPQKPSG